MSTKHYCDCCFKEITDSNKTAGAPDKDWRLGVNKEVLGGARVSLEVLVAVDGTWNSGDVCKFCVMDLLNASVGVRP